MAYSFHINEIIWALSGAIDLVGVTDILHGKRVAWLAREINRYLKLDCSENDLVIACLLHDCGVSSTDVHENLIREMEWSKASEHTIRGAELLEAQGLLKHLAPVIRHHHTGWEEILALGLDTSQGRLANLIFLADRLDVLIATSPTEILSCSSGILDRLEALSPRLFDPRAIRAMRQACRVEAIWMVRSSESLEYHFRDWKKSCPVRILDYGDLVKLFSLFSSCVDGKSSYTAHHSAGVRNLTMYLAALRGFRGETVRRIGLAGLLHDLGKLRVPDAILEKPGPLDEAEQATIRHHSFDTLEILSRIPGFDDVATWASQHHEKIDGSGYPFHRHNSEIPEEARIIAVADIFQALSQDRPYRQEPLTEGRIRRIIQSMADNGQLDASVVKLALDHFEECRACALSSSLS